MRNKLVFVSLFFLLMASLPLRLLPQMAEKPLPASTVDSAKNDSLSEQQAILSVARLCDDSFSDEAVTAVAILHKTNIAAGIAEEPAKDGDISPALLLRVKKLYRSCRHILTYRGKAVPVPLTACTCGSTAAAPLYPYLEAVASPWDAFCETHAGSSGNTGVSLNGIRWLCDTGLSAGEALRWYVPKLDMSPL